MYPLLETEEKTVILLYQKERLEKYLRMMQVQKLLTEEGYPSCLLEDILPVLCEKYEAYAETKNDFPHELGLVLGYPPEDVEGFIRHRGKNCLCTGYWICKGKFDSAAVLWIKNDGDYRDLRKYSSIKGTKSAENGGK